MFSPPGPPPLLVSHFPGLPLTPGDIRLDNFLGQEVVPEHTFQSAAYDVSQLIKANLSTLPPMSPDLAGLGLTPGLQNHADPGASPARRGMFGVLTSPLFKPTF